MLMRKKADRAIFHAPPCFANSFSHETFRLTNKMSTVQFYRSSFSCDLHFVGRERDKMTGLSTFIIVSFNITDSANNRPPLSEVVFCR